ncbi:MFS transporter [Candidatus Poribacteria bacterium]|nr:MFS transporter [Candidatus Poribacteria bacterium]
MNSSMHAILTLYLPSICLGWGVGLTIPIIPELAKTFHVSIATATLAFLAVSLGGAISTIPTGIAIDRIGRRGILSAGPIIVAISALATAFANSFNEVLIYRFLTGAGLQMWMIARQTVVADTSRMSTRGRQYASMFGTQRTGVLLGPLVGGLAADTWGLAVPFLLQGIVAIVGLLPSLFIMRETTTVAKPQKSRQTFLLAWRDMVAYPIPVVISIQFLTGVSRGGIEAGGIFFLYASYVYDADVTTLGLLSSSLAIVGIAVALSAGYALDRLGRKAIIVPGLLCISFSLALLSATWFAELPFLSFLIAFSVLHMSTSSLAGSMQTLAADVAPTGARGRFFGVSRLASQSGRITNPAIFALLTLAASYGFAFLALASMAFAGGMLTAFGVKDWSREENLPQN